MWYSTPWSMAVHCKSSSFVRQICKGVFFKVGEVKKQKYMGVPPNGWFIKGSLDEKLPSYELLKMLNNRFVK